MPPDALTVIVPDSDPVRVRVHACTVSPPPVEAATAVQPVASASAGVAFEEANRTHSPPAAGDAGQGTAAAVVRSCAAPCDVYDSDTRTS